MVSFWIWLSAAALIPQMCISAPALALNASMNVDSTDGSRCCTMLRLANLSTPYSVPPPDNTGMSMNSTAPLNVTSSENTTVYNNILSQYWANNAKVTPACFVSPESTEDVSRLVKALVQYQCPFAIKGIGHNPFPSNNINSTGVTIELSLLNKVSVAQTGPNNTAVTSIGPGANWGMVYDYLTPKNLMVGGGRAADVGTSGLTLGGGNSFFAAEKGFVCDNVVNFEVVLGSGEIVNANQTDNQDLWQALRGGSNNFGVVTRIDLTTFQSGNIWGGTAIYPASTIPDQINAFVEFTDKVASDRSASLISFFAYSAKTNLTIVENCYEYTQSVTTAPPIFEKFLALPTVPGTNQTMALRNLTSITTELEGIPNVYSNFMTLSFANNNETISHVYNLSNDLLQKHLDVQGIFWNTMFQPLPAVIWNSSTPDNRNIMGLERAKGNQVQLLLFSQWDLESDSERMIAAANELAQSVTDYTKSTGKYNDWIYLNYATEIQDPIGGYGKANVDKLLSVSRKYDPQGVFQKLVPGGFKLSNAKPTTA